MILTHDSVLQHLGEVTVAPLTNVIRGIPSEVELTDGDGMPRPCAVDGDHMQTVPEARPGGATRFALGL